MTTSEIPKRIKPVDISDDKISDNIELMSELKEVKSSVKNNVTSDYVLAHLDKAKEEFITENYGNAEYAKELIERFKKGYSYSWNEKTLEWDKDEHNNYKKNYLDDKQKDIIDKTAKRTFEMFMVQSHMIAILSRNKIGNPMVMKYMSNKNNENEEEMPVASMNQKNFFEKIMDKINGKQEESDDGY